MLKESASVKIRTFVPSAQAEKVRQAMGQAGAGTQGQYSNCSSSYKSTGRFTPGPDAKPAIGQPGQPEEVEEEAIEILCPKDKVKEVIVALKKVHPYQEPAIDILPRLEIE